MRAFEVRPDGEWVPLRATVDLPPASVLATLADMLLVAESGGALGLARDGAPVYALASERVGSATLARGLAHLAALAPAGADAVAARYPDGPDAFAAAWARFAPHAVPGGAPRLVLVGYRLDEGLDTVAAYLTDHGITVTLVPLVAFAASAGRRFVADLDRPARVAPDADPPADAPGRPRRVLPD